MPLQKLALDFVERKDGFRCHPNFEDDILGSEPCVGAKLPMAAMRQIPAAVAVNGVSRRIVQGLIDVFLFLE